MNASEIITSQINESNVRKVLDYYGFTHITGDTLLRCPCKIHGGNNPTAFVIDTRTGLWYCHTNCGGGDLFTLVSKIENVDFATSVRRISEIIGVNIEGYAITTHRPEYIQDTEKWLRFMQKKTKPIDEYKIETVTTPVNEYRDFKPETLRFFDLQYAYIYPIITKDNSEKIIYKRYVIPINFDNRCVGVSLRRVIESDKPKWLHQPSGLITSNLLYNYDIAKVHPEIIITEGMFDVWKFYECGFPNTVAVFGSHLTDEQIKLLIKSGATDVTLAYDSDEAGNKATKQAILKLKYKFGIKRLILPDGYDPCSCTCEELNEFYQRRIKIL